MANNLSVIFHDKELTDFLTRWPKRSKWAMKEAMQMAGGHIRKKVRKFIESGGSGWPALSFMTRRTKSNSRSPLYKMAQLVRFKAVGGKNPRVQIGFFTATKRGKAGFNKKERGRFKDYFGGTPAAMAKKHEFGKRVPITPEKRGSLMFGAIQAGVAPVRKSTKFVTVPARPMIGPVFQREKRDIPDYVGRKFWEKMTSKGGTYR